jgi:hypothetical protein
VADDQIGWNCVYHPVHEMRVVSDAEKEQLLATGVWFDHPTKAKDMRAKHEQRLHNEGRKGSRNRKPKARDGGSAT